MSFMKPTAANVNGPNSFNVPNIAPTASNFMVNNPGFDPRPQIQVTASDVTRPTMPPYNGYGAPTSSQFPMHHGPNMPHTARNMSPYTTPGSPFDPYRGTGPHGYGRY